MITSNNIQPQNTPQPENSRWGMRLLATGVVAMFACAFLTRCASIGNLDGGPYDTLPPVVLNVFPVNNTTNFTHEKVIFDFNEYIQIKEQQKELYTSPQMKKQPTLILRGKSLVLNMQDDSLMPNTTYAVEFGSSIVDNNEGNALHGLRYVFSTGEEIDSLVMSGYTEDSHKADSLGRTFIYFFDADSVETPKEWDSTLFKYKPQKIARSRNNGIFIAQNLKPRPYRVYAFYDNNNNQTYEAGIDKVGFLDSTYNPAQMPPFAFWYDSLRHYYSADPQLYLRLFTDVSLVRQSMRDYQRPEQHKVTLQFAAPDPEIEEVAIEGVGKDKIIYDYMSPTRDSIALWLAVESKSLPDTLKGEVTYFKHDSLMQLQKVVEPFRVAWRLVESREAERERERREKAKAKAEAEGKEWHEPPAPSKFRIVNFSSSSEVNPELHFPLEFGTPLIRFDSSAFSLRSWAEQGDTINEPFTFRADSLTPRKWRMKAAWQPTRTYELVIPPDALVDITGEGCDTLRCTMSVADKDKYALLRINITPRQEGAEYILQLLEGSSNKILHEVRHLGAGRHEINYVAAGDMRMRIIEDLNANGEWDGGNLVERRQSERAEFYKTDSGEEVFTTKTGWEFDLNLNMAKIFAPVSMKELIDRLDKREAARLILLEEERRKKEREKNKNNNSGSGLGMGSMGGMNPMGAMGGMSGIGGMSGGVQGGQRLNR